MWTSQRSEARHFQTVEWVDIANDLLMKCHINLHIKKLLECDANVFVHLYESILGEKVPDYITAPRTQEDDAHNVQAIIDSLALDYLQVSLSHITGENIVKGERESIRNLLEIFDGLLEYLTEVSEASSQTPSCGLTKQRFVQANLLCYVLLRSSQSEISIPFWEVEGSESTSELIKLGDTACSLSLREEGELKNIFRAILFTSTSLHICLQGSAESVHSTEFHKESLSSSAKKLGEPIRPAIPLQPPYQPSEPRPHYPIGREYQSPGRQSAALANSQTIKTPAVSDNLLLDFITLLPLSYLFSICFTSAPKEREYKENIFKEPPKMPRPVKVYSRKPTPRNPKHSQWIPRGGYAKPKKAAPMKVKDDDLLPLLLEEFPHLHISHHSLNKMWQQQLAQIERFKSSSGTERSRLKLQNEVEEALKKRDLLAEIIKKDQDHNKRLQEFKQRIHRQKWMQNKTREKRQQIARAKKYYEDYRVQLRARMMRARTREEKIFKNLFEEGLEIQKQRLEELRAYAKEKRAEQKRVQQNELESMENYYKDQFSMLAEAVSQEHQEIKTRERTQAKMLQKTKREVRSKVEKEIQQLQTMITQDDDDTFFRELEAERLKSRLQMASFQYSKNHFL
uniref:Centrosomal protein 95 n=1 Tax=Crocodylus porosus TaxID=8502 RepID=A0A7M4DWG7_CROPO